MTLTFRPILLGLCLTATVVAQQQMPRTHKEEIAGTSSVKNERLNGTVVSVDGNTLLVRMASGDIRMFTPPESRKFMIDGKELSVRDLKPGTRLTATVTTTTTPITERTTTIGSGKVWYVAGNTVIVTLPNGENRQYKVDDNYRFNIGGQKASVHDLKKGMTINAEKIVETPKTVLAENIGVTGHAPPEPKPAKTEVAQNLQPPAAAPRTERAAAPAAAPHTERAAAAPAPATPAATSETKPMRRLPATASSLPIVGGVGLLLLALSSALRLASRRL